MLQPCVPANTPLRKTIGIEMIASVFVLQINSDCPRKIIAADAVFMRGNRGS